MSPEHTGETMRYVYDLVSHQDIVERQLQEISHNLDVCGGWVCGCLAIIAGAAIVQCFK